MKTITIFEMLVFTIGVLLIISINYYVWVKSNPTYTTFYGLGIFEGLMLSSFARNAQRFPDMFERWMKEIKKE